LRGIYTLIILIQKPLRINVGELGNFKFDEGYYLYNGSALGKGASSLEARLKRHLSIRKKKFWHIDYLLQSKSTKIQDIIYTSSSKQAECLLNKSIIGRLRTEVTIQGFGSSDCRCRSHLLKIGGRKSLRKVLDGVKETYRSLHLTPAELSEKSCRNISLGRITLRPIYFSSQHSLL